MKTCRTCGREVGDWKFCRFCGTKLDEMDLSFQKTNTLLRQNVVLSDNTGNTENDSDLPRRVPAQYVDTHQPIDTVDLQEATREAVDTRTTYEQTIPDEAPIVDNGTTDPVSNESIFDEADLFADDLVTTYPLEEDDDTAEQELPKSHNSSDDEAYETVMQDDVESNHDEYSSAEQSTVVNPTEEPMMGDKDAEMVFSDESAASDTESVLNDGSARLFEETDPLTDDSEAAPADNNDSELPLDLGSLFNFTRPQKNESEEDLKNAEPERMPDHTQEETIDAVDDSPMIGVEPFDETGATTSDVTEINDDTPIEDAVNSKEETEGFFRVDFESVDTAENGFATFDTDILGGDAVVEETDATIKDEPSFVESQQGNPTPDRQETKLESQPFDIKTSAAKPHISVTDIDPMFGSAPTFDIDSIKASFQPIASSDKKKPKKGLFNRKK